MPPDWGAPWPQTITEMCKARHRRPWPGEARDRCACDRLHAGPTGLSAASRAHHSTCSRPLQTMASGVSGLPTKVLWGAPPRHGILVIKPEVCYPRVAPYIPLGRQDRTGHNSIIYFLLSGNQEDQVLPAHMRAPYTSCKDQVLPAHGGPLTPPWLLLVPYFLIIYNVLYCPIIWHGD